jgi:hypothetical protein
VRENWSVVFFPAGTLQDLHYEQSESSLLAARTAMCGSLVSDEMRSNRIREDNQVGLIDFRPAFRTCK